MRRQRLMWLAGVLLAVAGPAMAGGGMGAEDADQGSTAEAISGHWAHQGSECDGPADRQMRISVDGDTLTVNLGEASADETIESDRGGALTTHSDEGRFRYRILEGALTITDLGDQSVERLVSCDDADDSAVDTDEDAGKGDADDSDAGASGDEDSGDEDSGDDAPKT